MQSTAEPSKRSAHPWALAWARPVFRIKFILVWVLIIPLLDAFHIFFQHIEKREGLVMNDWVLNMIQVHNVSLPVFICIWGGALFAIYRGIRDPQLLLTMLWSYLLVSLARILCIWLVPLNPPPHLIPLVDPLTNFFYGKQYITKDLFFSGHTSSVYLVFVSLTRRLDKILLLILVIALAIFLLVQHVHYTIDILAAAPATWLCCKLGRKVAAT